MRTDAYTVRIFLIFLFITSQNLSQSKKNIVETDLFGSAEPSVRVRILNTLDSLRIRLLDEWQFHSGRTDPAVVYDKNDSVIITNSGGRIRIHVDGILGSEAYDSLKLKSATPSGELQISDVPYGVGWWWEGREDRTYEGEIFLYPLEDGNLEVVVELPLEKYLCGVVPYEMGGDSPPEALKAQAVAARSEAAVALRSNLYGGPRHDLTSDVECQVFSGNKRRTSVSDNAVRQTRGIILTSDDQPINAYYASNCGGHSEKIENVWHDRPAPSVYKRALKDSEDRVDMNLSEEDSARRWILSVPDVYCNPENGEELPSWSRNNFRWELEFGADSVSARIAGGGNLGELQNIIPLKRGSSGRIYLARFVFEKDSFEVKGELAIRQMWSPALRSSCFLVDKIGDRFVIKGAGWGHGVGMCQSGAIAKAKKESDFREILMHYYQGAELKIIY